MKEYKIEFEDGVVIEGAKKITKFENIVMCDCGRASFEIMTRYDLKKCYKVVVACKCGNQITITIPRKD